GRDTAVESVKEFFPCDRGVPQAVVKLEAHLREVVELHAGQLPGGANTPDDLLQFGPVAGTDTHRPRHDFDVAGQVLGFGTHDAQRLGSGEEVFALEQHAHV